MRTIGVSWLTKLWMASVRFVAGYGAAAAVPAPIKSAMKLLIGNWWMNRTTAGLTASAPSTRGLRLH